MKIPLALTALILLVVAGIGWQGGKRLETARDENKRLSAEAIKLGITLEDGRPAADFRSSQRDTVDRAEDARKTARDMVAFVKEMEARDKESQKQPSPELQERMLALMDEVASFDTAAMKAFIAEMRSNTDLKEEMREGLIGFSIMMLATDHPQAALSLYADTSDLLKKDNPMSGQVLASALSRLAKDSPEAALEWVRKNGEKFPDLVGDDAKRGIIRGTAADNPKLAFKLIGELKLDDESQALREITQSADTVARRDRILAAYREHLRTLTDPTKAANFSNSLLPMLAEGAVKEGFDSGSQWIASAKLSPEELESLTAGSFAYTIKRADTGKWAEWMSEKLPPEKGDPGIRNMVTQWTQNDHKAAGQWLDTTPEGPMRNSAIQAYAETVSKYEPEAAAEWAELLPSGKKRDGTLKKIYQSWPDRDSSPAAAAFAVKHGIKP